MNLPHDEAPMTKHPLLSRIQSAHDLHGMSVAQLSQTAGEIRRIPINGRLDQRFCQRGFEVETRGGEDLGRLSFDLNDGADTLFERREIALEVYVHTDHVGVEHGVLVRAFGFDEGKEVVGYGGFQQAIFKKVISTQIF